MPVYDDEKEKTISPKPDGSHDDLGLSPEERKAETDSLEKSLSSDQLAQAEEAPQSKPDKAAEAESDKLDDGEGWYKDDKQTKVKGHGFWTRRRKIAGGVAGVTVGVTLGVSSIISGPLQFIHIAQLLQRFHFQAVEDNGNGRMLKLYKYAKNKRAGKVENTRLGVIGNRIAQKIDARYAEIGLEKKYGGGLTAPYEGMTLDAKKFSENSVTGSDFKRLGEEDFMKLFKERYNVDLVPNGDGTFTIPRESGMFAYFKNRGLNSAMAEESGLNKISGAVATRVMGQRDGVTWHPIRAADSKIIGTLDQKFTAWLEEQKQRIRNGESEPVTASGEPANENGKPDPNQTAENASAADNTNQTAQDAERNIGPDGNPLPEGETTGLIKSITDSTAGKGVIGATAIVGIACALKGISDSAASVKHDLVILPLVRIGMEAITVGNQVMSGQDLNLEQLGFFSKQLYSQKDGSWASARSIQAELGQQQTGPDMPDDASPAKIESGGMFTTIINGVPLLGTICNAAESGLGKALSFAVSLTTPIATGLTIALTSTPAFKDAMSGLIRWLAGSPIPTMVFGANYGNFINYGSRLASNDAAASMGGKKLSPQQTAELRSYRLDDQKRQLSQESFAQRMFDPMSPDSLVSKTVDNISPSATTNVASLFSTLVNPMKVFAIFKSPLNSKLMAATNVNYDYGFPQVGFGLDELNSDLVENPYDNASAVTALLTGPNGSTYIDHAKNCFGVILTPDGNLTSDMNAQIDPTSKDYPDYCADNSPEWTRIRFYVLDMKTAESSDCFVANTTESCQASGFRQ